MGFTTFSAHVISMVRQIVGDLGHELGYLGSAIAVSAQYDAKKAFDAGVAAGKYAENSFIAIGKQELTDYWATIKDEIIQEKDALLNEIQTHGMESAVNMAKYMLDNINWRAVGVALTGIGETTLTLTARATLQMLVSGVLVAA